MCMKPLCCWILELARLCARVKMSQWKEEFSPRCQDWSVLFALKSIHSSCLSFSALYHRGLTSAGCFTGSVSGTPSNGLTNQRLEGGKKGETGVLPIFLLWQWLNLFHGPSSNGYTQRDSSFGHFTLLQFKGGSSFIALANLGLFHSCSDLGWGSSFCSQFLRPNSFCFKYSEWFLFPNWILNDITDV